MYTISRNDTAGVVVVIVGDGPIGDLAEVIDALEQDGIAAVRVTPAGDEHRQRAERIDRLLYDIGFDVR
jgi:threonine dehydrogenase-like Zn-dependent dehydrogenase